MADLPQFPVTSDPAPVASSPAAGGAAAVSVQPGYWQQAAQKISSYLPHGRIFEPDGPPMPPRPGPSPGPVTQLQYSPTTPQPNEPARIPGPPPVAQGPRTLAAHDVDVAGPKVRAAYETAENTQRHADEAIGDRNQEMARAGADVYQAQADDAAAREAQVKAQAAQQSAGLDAQKADFDRSSAEAAKVQIDNDRLWNSKSKAQRAAFHVANFFSSLGKASTGGVNTHLQRWQEAQKADVDAQKHHYDALRGRVGDKQTAYAMGMQKYQNENQAREFANATHVEGLKAGIGKLAERYKGTAAANEADQRIAEADALKADHERQFTKHVQAQTVAAPGALTAAQQFELRKMGIEHSYKVDEAKAAAGAKEGDQTQALAEKYVTAQEESGKPVFQTAQQSLAELAARNGGELPNTTFTDRALQKAQELPLVGGIANWARGTDARQADGALENLAMAEAKADGRVSPELIKEHLRALRGGGQTADVNAGLARIGAKVQNKSNEAAAAFPAQVKAIVEARKKALDADSR